MVNKLFLIGLGGFVGTILRYILSGAVHQLSKSISFPYGTLFVNLFGCLCVGFLSYLAEERGLFTAMQRQLVFIGILGGFTTFSTFMNETLHLSMDGKFFFMLMNVVSHVVLGFSAVWLGRAAAHFLWR